MGHRAACRPPRQAQDESGAFSALPCARRRLQPLFLVVRLPALMSVGNDQYLVSRCALEHCVREATQREGPDTARQPFPCVRETLDGLFACIDFIEQAGCKANVDGPLVLDRLVQLCERNRQLANPHSRPCLRLSSCIAWVESTASSAPRR